MPGYNHLYEVSDRGCVRSLQRRVLKSNGVQQTVPARVLKPHLTDDGYLAVSLYNENGRRTFNVAVLVARAFIGPRPVGLEVLHNDGANTNNRSSNLRYGTRQENMIDAKHHGAMPRGERQHNSRLTEKEVRAILKSASPAVILAAEFGVSYAHIRGIKTGRSWQWLNKN